MNPELNKYTPKQIQQAKELVLGAPKEINLDVNIKLAEAIVLLAGDNLRCIQNALRPYKTKDQLIEVLRTNGINLDRIQQTTKQQP